MTTAGVLAADEPSRLARAARALHFKRRTFENVVALAGLPPTRARAAHAQLAAHRVSQKAIDAVQMIAAMRADAGAGGPGFEFNRTLFIAELERRVSARRGGRGHA